jgi:hypothetical protein
MNEICKFCFIHYSFVVNVKKTQHKHVSIYLFNAIVPCKTIKQTFKGNMNNAHTQTKMQVLVTINRKMIRKSQTPDC